MTNTLNGWDDINSENVWINGKAQSVNTSIPSENVESSGKIENSLAAQRRDFESARNTMAELVLADRAYIPLFEWAESRLAAIDAKVDTIARAQKVVDDQMATRRKAFDSSPSSDVAKRIGQIPLRLQ